MSSPKRFGDIFPLRIAGVLWNMSTEQAILGACACEDAYLMD